MMTLADSPHLTSPDEVDTYSQPMILSISMQAYRYGEQVRLLENSRMTEDRTRVRRAWRGFLDQLDDSNLWWFARMRYREAYTQHWH